MLPFMRPKRDSSVLIVKDRKPDTPAGEDSHETGDELREVEEAAAELQRILKAEPVDVKRLAQCLKMIHEVCSDLQGSDTTEENNG